MSMKEIEHYFRVTDMMVSMHSYLRDRYARNAVLIDIALLCVSVVLCAAVLIDPVVLNVLRVAPVVGRTAVGICSIVVFVISVIQLRVNWTQMSQRHARAAEILSGLKLGCRALLRSESEADSEEVEEKCQECRLALSSLPSIPDRMFDRLKVWHRRKIELSKLIDKHPGCPLFLLSLKLSFGAIRKASGRESNAGGEEVKGE